LIFDLFEWWRLLKGVVQHLVGQLVQWIFLLCPVFCGLKIQFLSHRIVSTLSVSLCCPRLLNLVEKSIKNYIIVVLGDKTG
jgi:hypothetical protein